MSTTSEFYPCTVTYAGWKLEEGQSAFQTFEGLPPLVQETFTVKSEDDYFDKIFDFEDRHKDKGINVRGEI